MPLTLTVWIMVTAFFLQSTQTAHSGFCCQFEPEHHSCSHNISQIRVKELKLEQPETQEPNMPNFLNLVGL